MGRALSSDTLYFEEQILTSERSDRDVELLTRLLELDEGTKVLDAACGRGRHSNRLAARGCCVVGLDNDPLVLEHARDDASALGVAPHYAEGDLRQLPFEDVASTPSLTGAPRSASSTRRATEGSYRSSRACSVAGGGSRWTCTTATMSCAACRRAGRC